MNAISKVMLLTAMICLGSGHAGAEVVNDASKAAALQALGLVAPMPSKISDKLKNRPITMSLNDIYTMSASNAFAARSSLGGMDGGGGKILLIKEGQKTSAVVLDVYEAQKRPLTIDMGPGTTLQQKLDYVLNRLSRIAPFRANAYKQWINDLLTKESEFGEDVLLPATEDLGATMLPRNSQIVQVIVQRNEQDTKLGLSRYLIDRNVFSQLDIESQAALIFHEVVYREARLRGETSSLASRYLTGVILSKEITMIDVVQLNTILSKVGSRCLEEVYGNKISTCRDFPPLTFWMVYYGQDVNNMFKTGSMLEHHFATYDKFRAHGMLLEAFGKRPGYNIELSPIDDKTPVEFITTGDRDHVSTITIPAARVMVSHSAYRKSSSYFIADCSITIDFNKQVGRMTCSSTEGEACSEAQACGQGYVDGKPFIVDAYLNETAELKMTSEKITLEKLGVKK